MVDFLLNSMIFYSSSLISLLSSLSPLQTYDDPVIVLYLVILSMKLALFSFESMNASLPPLAVTFSGGASHTHWIAPVQLYVAYGSCRKKFPLTEPWKYDRITLWKITNALSADTNGSVIDDVKIYALDVTKSNIARNIIKSVSETNFRSSYIRR